MVEENQLDEDFSTFREEILRDAEFSGEPQHAAFFLAYASTAAENGDIEDLTYVPIIREGPKPYQVDGYAWDADRGELHLAVCDYHAEETLSTINADRVNLMFNRVRRFCELAVDREFVYSLEETSPAFDLATLICETQRDIHRIRCVLFSNAKLAIRKKTLDTEVVLGVEMTHNILDFRRYIDIQNAQGGNEPIQLDVRELNAGHLLPCLNAHDGNQEVESYLIVMPGALLAKIYGLYGARLMEQNVRTFLQARTKTNKGIIETAISEPQMFFAYNNGITATASGVEVETSADSTAGISRIENLQIVNGGQTTASILYASDRGAANLSSIFIQMKLSVIETDRIDEVVPKISRFANTQNRVSEADFFSNHQFHVVMQQISRRLSAPAKAGSIATTKWFYERARGQYRNEMVRKSAADRGRFQSEYPRNQVITKTDLAKYQLSFRPEPHTVSLGAQKCFLSFAQEIGKKWEKSEASQAQFNDSYFREVVAKAIIFKEFDGIVLRSAWYKEDRGYKANIVTYTIGWLVQHLKSRKRAIDFALVWNRQCLPEELEECLDSLAPQIAKLLKSPPAGISNISEYAKKAVCWDRISQENLGFSGAIDRVTIDLEETRERERDAKATGKIDLEIMFDSLLVEYHEKILSLEPFVSERGLLSPASAQAIAKLRRGDINLARREKNALKALFKRLDDDYLAGPENWK